jgi:hypothetical protein
VTAAVAVFSSDRQEHAGAGEQDALHDGMRDDVRNQAGFSTPARPVSSNSDINVGSPPSRDNNV